jgi:hypothetical protein
LADALLVGRRYWKGRRGTDCCAAGMRGRRWGHSYLDRAVVARGFFAIPSIVVIQVMMMLLQRANA